jgi:hypothetical protein
MKELFVTLLIVGAGGSLIGCAHVHSVGSPIAKSEIPEGIQVGIGGQEVSEGEKVAVMKSVCKKVTRNRGGSFNQCHYEKAGEALVLKVLDHDSAIVRPDEGLQMDSSMRVEKQ